MAHSIRRNFLSTNASLFTAANAMDGAALENRWQNNNQQKRAVRRSNPAEMAGLIVCAVLVLLFGLAFAAASYFFDVKTAALFMGGLTLGGLLLRRPGR